MAQERIILKDLVGKIDWIGNPYWVKCKDGEKRIKRDFVVLISTVDYSGKDTVQYYYLTTWTQHWVNELNQHDEEEVIQFDLEITGSYSIKDGDYELDKCYNRRVYQHLSPLPKKWDDDPTCGYLKTIEKPTIDRVDDTYDGVDEVIEDDDSPF